MGQLVFQATLGGQVNLVGPNTASTFNLNVPAVSSTIATLTGTETFTNKTLTTPVISSLSSASATALTLQSAGTTAITVDTSQNVGIGTTSPNVGGLTRALTLNAPTGGNYSGFELAGAGTQTARFVANNTATYFGTTPATPLVFETNNTERMRINAGAPILCLAGGSTSATGTGIAFPATQSASSDANTLDDYEEGTWTPNQGSGLTVVGAFSSSGRYTKIGRVVYVSGRLQGATTIATTAGTIMFTNLPFTIADITSTGVIVNGSLNTFGGLGGFTTTVYSTTTIPANQVIDFSFTFSV